MQQYSNIDLQNLQHIFDVSIYPYAFIYTLEDDRVIELTFEQSQLSHLLGIQKIDKRRADLKGKLCYDSIKNGNITYDVLKSINAKALKSECKDKLRYFDELPLMLRNPDCICFDQNAFQRYTMITMSFALHGKDKSSSNQLILGIDSNDNASYFPRTWLIEKDDKKSILSNQHSVKIKNVEIILRNNQNQNTESLKQDA